MLPVRKLKRNSGQSLLEVTIVIGLVVIVLMAVSSVVIHGLETSQVAQNQAQATKLASQGLDIVRNIRDTGGTVCVNGSISNWDSSFWQNSNPCTSGTCNFKITSPAGTCNTSTTSDPWLKPASSATDYEIISGTQFSRQIVIGPTTPPSKDRVLVTSTVYWTDYSGEHSTSQVTILANI